MGRWVVYVVAQNIHGIGLVLKHFLPALYDEGYDVLEEIPVPMGHQAWSVSVGPEGRTKSLVVTAPDEREAKAALVGATLATPDLAKYVEMELYVTRAISLDKEGVF